MISLLPTGGLTRVCLTSAAIPRLATSHCF